MAQGRAANRRSEASLSAGLNRPQRSQSKLTRGGRVGIVGSRQGGRKLCVSMLRRCCQTNAPKHQYPFDEFFYEVTKERHSVRAASRFSLNVLRFESDLCELNRL